MNIKKYSETELIELSEAYNLRVKERLQIDEGGGAMKEMLGYHVFDQSETTPYIELTAYEAKTGNAECFYLEWEFDVNKIEISDILRTASSLGVGYQIRVTLPGRSYLVSAARVDCLEKFVVDYKTKNVLTLDNDASLLADRIGLNNVDKLIERAIQSTFD